MTANHFFIDSGDVRGNVAKLTGGEHHHLSRVVRTTSGDDVWLFDERGTTYRARVEAVAAEHTLLVILSREHRQDRPIRITLGQALLKAKAMESVVQKAAELGVYAVAPIVAARSVVRSDNREIKLIDRWTKIAVAAAKQSRAGIIPRMIIPRPLAEVLNEPGPRLKLVLNERSGRPLRDIVLNVETERLSDITILIGPEGGWTPDEERRILAAGYTAVILGGTVLRAETAALAATAILAHFWME